MKKNVCRFLVFFAAALFLSVTVMEYEAQARAGGGSKSSGSRGSRSMSRPATPPASPAATAAPRQQQAAPSPAFQQPASGGFLRSMAGGIAGGILGGMLFRSMGFSGPGTGGMGGGGIGLFEILLLAGIGYLIYRYIKKKREQEAVTVDSPTPSYQSIATGTAEPVYIAQAEEVNSVDTGLSHIRQFDPAFDENRFCDQVMDNFFKIQGAWANRDLTSARAVLTDEMAKVFQNDIDRLINDKQINRLENIAVRNVEIAEAWQESGQDFVTALIYANLLDYTVNESDGSVITGSKNDPVKFEEYWTFNRPVGNNAWRLSAIDQK